MAPNALSSLPASAQVDFREAGICIAFERPTAVAFHLMRLLRRPYATITVAS
jgi:hypothetical protein